MGGQSLFDMVSFLDRLRRSFKPALLVVLFLTLLALVIVLLIPREYISEGAILPPYSAAGGSNVLSQLSGLMGGFSGNFALPAMVSPSDLYAALLQSPTIIDPVINKFGLKERYNAQYITGVRASFRKKLEVKITREGMVKVRYREKSPELASAIVNSLMDELDKLNRNLRIWSARNYRIFVEKRLDAVKTELETRKLALVDFQQLHKLASPEGQIEYALSSAADIESEIIKTEIELTYLSNYLSEDNPKIKALQRKINNFKLKLDSLEVEKGSLLPPINALPDIYYEYLSLLRDYKVSETVYEYLNQQYEQAQIEEAKDIPVIQLLYEATPQPGVFVPKRRKIIVVVFICAVALVFLWMLFLHLLERWKEFNPDKANKLARIYDAFLREMRLKR